MTEHATAERTAGSPATSTDLAAPRDVKSRIRHRVGEVLPAATAVLVVSWWRRNQESGRWGHR